MDHSDSTARFPVSSGIPYGGVGVLFSCSRFFQESIVIMNNYRGFTSSRRTLVLLIALSPVISV